MKMHCSRWLAVLGLTLLLWQPLPSQAAENASSASNNGAAATDELEALKKEVLDLNRDLFILEEDLLFPASTQVAVFISLDVGKYFRPDAVKLNIDGKQVGNHLYTERDVSALRRGGVQRLYIGNLTSGQHEVVALFTGMGPENREYTRATSITFVKETGAKFIELRIVDDSAKQQANFEVRQW